MVFPVITALVVIVLAYAFRQLADPYGGRTLLKLSGVTLVFFFVKEYLQAHRLLVHHYYGVNHAVWFSVLGVPPFIVLGHLFVVVMTWQLAVMTMHRLELVHHPATMVMLVWHFTAAFAMLMENTGIVGRWWVWQMPSWWWFPSFLGAPLMDLPTERPITEVWGYFISTFWFVLLLTNLPRRWTVQSVLVMVVCFAAFLEGSRSTGTAFWIVVARLLPFVSVLWPSLGATGGRALFLPRDSVLFRAPGPKQNAAILLGLSAMCVVCIAQLGVKSKWPELVSLFPIVAFTAGAFRRWPVWVDGAVSAGLMLLGFLRHDGNTMLAAWLVLRLAVVELLLLAAVRWREGRPGFSAAGAPLTAPAQSLSAAP